MKEVRIYTAGKMGGLSLAEQMQWRDDFLYVLGNSVDDTRVNITCIHPPLFYRYDLEDPDYKTLDEIMTWDLTQLSTCNIMVVNLDGIDTSIGTCIEIGYVDALNSVRDKKIFIIGIGSEENLHPWIKQSMFRIEDSIESAVEYIKEFLLV